MTQDRGWLEAEFMRICRARGPQWIESVLRPLRLGGNSITARDIPVHALVAIVQMFGRVRQTASE